MLLHVYEDQNGQSVTKLQLKGNLRMPTDHAMYMQAIVHGQRVAVSGSEWQGGEQ